MAWVVTRCGHWWCHPFSHQKLTTFLVIVLWQVSSWPLPPSAFQRSNVVCPEFQRCHPPLGWCHPGQSTTLPSPGCWPCIQQAASLQLNGSNIATSWRLDGKAAGKKSRAGYRYSANLTWNLPKQRPHLPLNLPVGLLPLPHLHN